MKTFAVLSLGVTASAATFNARECAERAHLKLGERVTFDQSCLDTGGLGCIPTAALTSNGDPVFDGCRFCEFGEYATTPCQMGDTYPELERLYKPSEPMLLNHSVVLGPKLNTDSNNIQQTHQQQQQQEDAESYFHRQQHAQHYQDHQLQRLEHEQHPLSTLPKQPQQLQQLQQPQQLQQLELPLVQQPSSTSTLSSLSSLSSLQPMSSQLPNPPQNLIIDPNDSNQPQLQPQPLQQARVQSRARSFVDQWQEQQDRTHSARYMSQYGQKQTIPVDAEAANTRPRRDRPSQNHMQNRDSVRPSQNHMKNRDSVRPSQNHQQGSEDRHADLDRPSNRMNVKWATYVQQQQLGAHGQQQLGAHGQQQEYQQQQQHQQQPQIQSRDLRRPAAQRQTHGQSMQNMAVDEKGLEKMYAQYSKVMSRPLPYEEWKHQMQ